MPKGTIKRLIKDRGFGFIKIEQGEDLFFHRSELQGVDYDSLGEGQEVEFEVGRGRIAHAMPGGWRPGDEVNAPAPASERKENSDGQS